MEKAKKKAQGGPLLLPKKLQRADQPPRGRASDLDPRKSLGLYLKAPRGEP